MRGKEMHSIKKSERVFLAELQPCFTPLNSNREVFLICIFWSFFILSVRSEMQLMWTLLSLFRFLILLLSLFCMRSLPKIWFMVHVVLSILMPNAWLMEDVQSSFPRNFVKPLILVMMAIQSMLDLTMGAFLKKMATDMITEMLFHTILICLQNTTAISMWKFVLLFMQSNIFTSTFTKVM